MGDEEEDPYSSSPMTGRRSGVSVGVISEVGSTTPLRTPYKTPIKGSRGGVSPRRLESPTPARSLFRVGKSESPFSFEKFRPEIFDNISFDPERDDPEIARFNNSSTLISASIPRLIVQLTCHDILDYNFMSDFFLSYRIFMSSDDLLECLLSRLGWAINLHYKVKSGDYKETGRDIAVRIFVVIRHWILNFFPDDFLVSFRLRSKFSSSINKLYTWKLVQDEPHFRRILEQLKKTWIRACCMYWQLGTPLINDNFDVSLPIFPGGTYGQVNVSSKKSARTRAASPAPADITPAQRRLTLLSFYKGPIKPVVSNSDLKDFQNSNGLIPEDGNEGIKSLPNGSLINGGITLSSDVEVKSIKPPTPVRVVEKSASKNVNIPLPSMSSRSRNLMSMMDSWKQVNKPIGNKLLAKFSKIMAMPKSKEHEYTPLHKKPEDNIRIDILSARVIEELDLFLKMRFNEDQVSRSSRQVTRRKLDRLSSSSESPTKRQRLNSVNVNSKASIDLYSLSDEKDQNDRSNRVESVAARSTRTSMIDSLGIQDRLNNTSNAALSDAFSERDFEFSDALSSLTSSGRDDSLYSFVSYDSANSIGTVMDKTNEGDNENEMGLRKLRRWGNHENLREITNFSSVGDGRNESELNETIEPITKTKENNLPSNHSEKMILPYSGVDSEVAAQLAAIPDDTPDDDAIKAALLKLEGKYVKRSSTKQESGFIDEEDSQALFYADNIITHSESADSTNKFTIQYTASHNSNLFKAAFESKTDIVGLTAPSSPGLLLAPTKASSAGKTIHYKHPTQSPNKSIRSRSSQDPLSVPNIINHGNHTPFILNFGSDILSAQFTLIEKDALAEVDWKDLIEMRWSRKVIPTQSWLEFLIERDSTGVELVISRFNLMVNWIKSEILLTRQLDERVQTISRFIHIGHQARNMQNFATVMQIVLALQSAVISNLKITWQNVSNNDNELLRQMTELTSPLRNFANLRSELKELQPNKGCVPFVGMYLSDLTFNSERPTFVNKNSKNTLINFEKFQTSSSIVKSLLQCIEWSTNYKLKSDQELLAKCLYIQSLTVEEMDMCFDYLIDP